MPWVQMLMALYIKQSSLLTLAADQHQICLTVAADHAPAALKLPSAALQPILPDLRTSQQ